MDRSPLAIVNAHREKLVAEIASRPGWEESSYVLRTMSGWDDPKLPIIVAIPKAQMIDWSPTFAVLPDGQLVSNSDRTAFSRIVAARFPSIAAADASAIARLAVMFGGFDAPVGKFVTAIPGSARVSRPPRPNGGASLRQDGADSVVEFYAFDYELMVLHDCQVALGPAGVSTKYQRLTPDSRE